MNTEHTHIELQPIGPLATFTLRETVAYPNGGASAFYVGSDTAVIIDNGICQPPADGKAFGYSLVTSKQNAYVAEYTRVYRLLREDAGELGRWLAGTDSVGTDGTCL